jgi:hypothetical protein
MAGTDTFSFFDAFSMMAIHHFYDHGI